MSNETIHPYDEVLLLKLFDDYKYKIKSFKYILKSKNQNQCSANLYSLRKITEHIKNIESTLFESATRKVNSFTV